MGQTYTCLRYHLIFGTKARTPHITPDIQTRLYDYVGGIIKREGGALICAGGTADHVHLLASLHPQSSVVEIVRKVKANSSKWIHESFSQMSAFAWQTGYAAFTVSQANVEDVQRYISNQEVHHRKKTFEEELIEFVERHGIPYDIKYVSP